MKEIKFIFDGGLGNQLFQFFASKYLLLNFKELKIKYASSNSIRSGYRNLEINKLIKEPIKVYELHDEIIEKFFSKIIKNLPISNKKLKRKLKSKIYLLNSTYYEKKEYSDFQDSLSLLKNDLNILKNRYRQLKIKGFWQNPKSYLENFNYYNNFLIDTKKYIPSGIEPNSYITIHIRRGDYFLKENFRRYLTKFSSIEFILLSIQLLPEENKSKPIYLISDDQAWVENLIPILSSKSGFKFLSIKTKNNLEDWSLMRHASINICANSTFSYTAALLNNENSGNKLRSIIPQWIQKDVSAYEKGWLTPKGFLEI